MTLSLWNSGLNSDGFCLYFGANSPISTNSPTNGSVGFNFQAIAGGTFPQGSGDIKSADSIQNVFGHLFWVLSWNILARSINTASISLRHLDWNGDALQVFICQAKNDQEGDKSEFPKNVYANPVMPEICPILALGIYFLVVQFEPRQSKLSNFA
jgi:hypothetical protein